MMGTTPLIDRIRERQEPTPITERMSPFMRRLREKNLPTQDSTASIYSDGVFVPRGQKGAA
jgi:hypothetical protein